MVDNRRAKSGVNAKLRAKMCETHSSDERDDTGVSITFADPLELITLAREDPVMVAREAQAVMTTLETGFNQHRIEVIGAAYAAAYHMLMTDGAWQKFLKCPCWGGLSGKPKNTLRHMNRALHHVLRYVFRAEAAAARNRVRVYANMLVDQFHKGFKPEDVVPLIRSRGIESLRKEGEAARKAVRASELDGWLADLDDDAPPRKPSRGWGIQKKAHLGPLDLLQGDELGGGERQPPRFDPHVHVAVRGGQFLERILAIGPRARLWIAIERADDGGNDDRKEFDVVGVSSMH